METDILFEQVVKTNSLLDYKKYAEAVIEAESKGEFEAESEVVHEAAAAKIIEPLIQCDLEANPKLEEIMEIANLLDLPPSQDEKIDRGVEWQKIAELIKSL